MVHEVRNAIAHKRYEVQDDGSALLWDYRPNKQIRKNSEQLTQIELEDLTSSLERAVTVLEMSVPIFEHNNGRMLYQLGHYGPKDEYTDKPMREMIYLTAPAEAPRAGYKVCNNVSAEQKTSNRNKLALGLLPFMYDSRSRNRCSNNLPATRKERYAIAYHEAHVFA